MGDENRGVTLIELLVVIAIIATILTLSTPTFIKLLTNIEQRAFVRKIYSSLKFARSQAVIEGVTYRVNFDSKGIKITKDGKKIIRLFPPEGIEMIFFPGENELLFYPKGNSSGGFIIIKGGDTHYKLEIRRSGRVKVMKDDEV